MKARRITETMKVNRDHEKLLVITVFEEGLSKERVKKENPHSKKHHVLYPSYGSYEFK